MATDGYGIVGEHHQLRAIAHFVRHVKGAARKADGVEGVAVEDAANAVVELRPRLAGIHIALLTADDLVEIRLREKAHRGAGAVVQVGGALHEAFARRLDEADVQRRGEHRVAQFLRREALQPLVEGQRVQEGGSGNVGGVGRQAAVVLGIDALSERLAFAATGGDVAGDGRREGGLPKARHQFLADRLLAQVDVVQVYCGGVGRPLLP